ncbi:type II toxin-antitoxin system VapB family antitoxin [Mycobacterium sp. 21AC1]|uniref:ribbon-helix-helix protein, CopG family n=1 Tax=[Mycobacterium] appelbergii TaxID=2939269 RepID=UPI0029394129|nr:ribbon-helix-helix protein, CopG family [Mycobacterium sp. 21AC1]MDV3125752.1 type II toxin-antitoxin system VapB family antitoxin [Mycobacterium sp. 21AC1]
MRTTVSIDDELLAAAKRRAQQRGQTVGSVIEDALRRELSADADPAPRPAVPVFTGGTGPRPGIDLRSNRALQEVLDDGTELNSRR